MCTMHNDIYGIIMKCSLLKIKNALCVILAVTVVLSTAAAAVVTGSAQTVYGSGYTQDSRFNSGYDIYDCIDVSYHNGVIDWQKVYAAGIKYVFMRVGYRGSVSGKMVEDVKFEDNYAGAKAAGLKVGVYFYTQAVSENEAADEAEFAVERLKNKKIDLPVVYDCEYAEDTETADYAGRFYDAQLTRRATTNLCLSFCKTVEKAGYKGMVYANPYMLTSRIYAEDIEKSYPVWLAAYRKNANYAGEYTVWQYSSTGTVDGISTKVDMNFLYVKKENGTVPETPAQPEEPPVVVEKPVLPQFIKIDSIEPAYAVTTAGFVSAKVENEKLTAEFGECKVSEVYWSSDNESVFTVDEEGVFEAVGTGEAKVTASITVTYTDKNGKEATQQFSDTVTVTVKPVEKKSTDIISLIIRLLSLFINLFTK